MAFLGEAIRPYLPQVAMALVATILVLYGADVNRAVRQRVHDLHFAWRLLIFVALCAFGYGLLLFFGALLLAWLLRHVTNPALLPVVLLLFLVVGFLAERRHQM